MSYEVVQISFDPPTWTQIQPQKKNILGLVGLDPSAGQMSD